MSQRDPGVYLEDIEHYAAAAIRFTSGLSLEQYLADEKTRAAVERVLEICGEAMNGLYRIAPSVAEKIPHARDIIGFRNILAHGYAELDHNKVYNIAIMVTGLAENVPECGTRTFSSKGSSTLMTSLRPASAPTGNPPPMILPSAVRSGRMA
jgi:uncharacterized protein with HEPN domain